MNTDASPIPSHVRDGLDGACALDADFAPGTDPLASTRWGAYEIHSSLIRGNPKTLLGFNLDPAEVSPLVLLRRIPDPDAPAFANNAQHAVSVAHPNLERVIGVERTPEGAYWVSELLPGATLTEIRAACKSAKMNLPMGFALAAVYEAAKGLQRIHAPSTLSFSGPRRAAHGLIRPQNVVVSFTGRASLLNPQYLPFPPSYTPDSQPLAGNAGYLSPEAARGEMLDARSDVFSIAVLVHEALTDRELFRGQTPRDRAQAVLRGEVPPPSRLNLSLNAKVDEVVLKALSPDPAARYPNAETFCRALYDAAGGFMAREAQRAQLMERLFPGRSQRLQSLATTVARERQALAAAHAAEQRRLEEERVAQEREEQRREEEARLAALAQAEAQATRAAQLAVAAAAAPAGAAKVQSAARPAPQLPKTKLLLVAGGGVLLLALGVTAGALLSRKAPPPAPPPVVTPTPVVAAPPPPPVAATPPPAPAEAAPAATAAPTEGSTVAPTEGAPEGEQAPKKKKKKRRDDSVIPPWLR